MLRVLILVTVAAAAPASKLSESYIDSRLRELGIEFDFQVSRGLVREVMSYPENQEAFDKEVDEGKAYIERILKSLKVSVWHEDN